MLHLPQPLATAAITLCALATLGTGCAGRSLSEEVEPTVDTSGYVHATTPTDPDGDPPTDPDTATEPQGSVDPASQTTLAAPEQIAAAEEACQKQPQGNRATPTEAAFQELLVGTWLLCDPVSVFGTADAGLVIHADFTWQKLLRTDSGELVPSSAWEQSGSWDSLDTSGMNGAGIFQLNIAVDGSGMIYTHPVFAIEPDVMRLNNNGVFVADYAKL
jgi:hypothetical protein